MCHHKVIALVVMWVKLSWWIRKVFEKSIITKKNWKLYVLCLYASWPKSKQRRCI